ncbi:bifunctional molybdenum cofactor biosynthesis protein MoaC/MoaB [Stratiformator vulcanicus]|uniref:cyclic pyranopterin monophosphate synthase n=1 Tax=Stratiformator vulcanicus TaxID=2527980 RepID=A0A517QWA1_9PLAN|nr:bifunctional molybdenum cofactor biosynthesis protein MoaC/MoaB [Stratiformator vulcanicus]QDT35867.1 Cyclic pyranopterin monophosphate synthase accessory protein 2 [Stratiformator vulcanicus]
MNEQKLTHVDASSGVNMVDVGDKPVTARRAIAEGIVRAAPETLIAFSENRMPKGPVIETARLAGIGAAKKTFDLVPLCHQLPLEDVRIDFRFAADQLFIRAEVSTTAKTGVEMEALTAVSVAGLTIIDMGKAIDREMSLERIRVVEKSGGRSGTHHFASDFEHAEVSDDTGDKSKATEHDSEIQPPIRAAILTVSDRCARGERTDTSGPALGEMVRRELAGEVVWTGCVPDDAAQIERSLIDLCDDEAAVDLILSTGGTGLAPRDVTPEAAAAVIEREHAGLMELARARCASITPKTYLSRGIAGTRKGTLIITLPGSERGATETLGGVIDILPHAIETLRGDVKDG